MIQVKNSTIHYINERALTFSENDLNDPMRVAVSLVSGTVIMAYVPGTIDYAADGNYERWTLKGYSTKLIYKEAYFVYARLSRTDRTALIVFSVKDYNINGSITTVTGKDENGNDITETTDPSTDYFYIKIGELTATDKVSPRELTYDSGLLSTKKGDSMTESSNMWELIPGVDPLINALHKLKDFTVKGFITLVGGLKFSKGKEGDEKVIADVKRSVDSDNEYILNQDGTPVLDELGNPVPNPDYVPVSDDTLPTTKYLHGKLEGFDDKYLRKDQDDRTAHSLSIGGKTTAEGGIQVGSEFASGLTGYGANIDGKGQAELHSLFVRTFLEVPEMRYNRITVRMGDEINSVSAGIIERVEPSADGSGTGTLWLKLEDGEFGSLEVDDLVMQIFSDMRNPENNAEENSDDGKGNRTMKGFATVYFEVVSVSGDRNEKIEYKLREDARQIHPYAMGPFSQRGNRSNAERQTIIYQGIFPKPYTRYMKDVDQWEFTYGMVGMQLGYLGNLTVPGYDLAGYSAYVNNIYLNGFIFELTPQQKEELSAYSVSLSEYVGSIRVDSEGNIIAGEYTPVNVVTGEENVVTGEENVVTGEYLLQTRVQVHKGAKELAYTSGVPEEGQFTCSISGVGCTAGIANGVISVTSVEDFSYCYVKIETLCEGRASFYNTYQVKVIKDGSSAFSVDVYNEKDSIACDEEGNYLFGLPVECVATAWYGQRQLGLIRMEIDVPQGVEASADKESGKVTVTGVSKDAPDVFRIGIRVYVELFGMEEMREASFTVSKSRQGLSATIYDLFPSANVVKVNEAGEPDVDELFCRVREEKHSGVTILEELPENLRMEYRVGTGDYEDYEYGTPVPVGEDTGSVAFVLYQDGVLMDSEKILVVKDGSSPLVVDVDNEMDSVACDENGKVLFGLPVSCNVSAWYGNGQLDIEDIRLTVPEGVTAVAVRDADGKITGRVEVSGISEEAPDTIHVSVEVHVGLFGVTESRNLVFTVNKVRQGESALLYKLLPSVASVKVRDDGVPDVQGVSCSVLKVNSVGAEELDSLDGTGVSIQYSIDRGDFTDYAYGQVIGISDGMQSVSFRLYLDGVLMDAESVPVVKDGNAIKEVGEFYLATSYGYGEGVTREDGEWGIWVEGLIPELSEEKRYLWNYEVISYTGTEPTYTEPAIIAMWTKDGKGVKDVHEWYQVNNDKDNAPSYPHVEGDKWVRDTAPVMSEDAKYLWNYEEIHWTDGSVTYTEPAMIGAKGETGATTPVLSVSHGAVSRNSLGSFDPATVIVSVRRGVEEEELWMSAFGIRVKEDGTEEAFYLGSTDSAVSRWNVELGKWSVAIDTNDITSVVFRAYLSLVDNYGEPGIAEHGITFVQQGEVGAPGPMPRNRGEYDGSTEYFYNDEYRDYVWKPNGLVYLRQGRGYTSEGAGKGAIIGIEPSGTVETEYWVPASVASLTAINTALIDNADIAGFKFKDNLMVSQDFHHNTPDKKIDATIILDGKTGYFKCNDAEVKGLITVENIEYDIQDSSDDALVNSAMVIGPGEFVLPEIREGYTTEIKALFPTVESRTALPPFRFGHSQGNGGFILFYDSETRWGKFYDEVTLEPNILYTFLSYNDNGVYRWMLTASTGEGAPGSAPVVDDKLDGSSANPVQNAVVTNKFSEIGTKIENLGKVEFITSESYVKDENVLYVIV